MPEFIHERKDHIKQVGADQKEIACAKPSAAGSVSQRACVFCGSRVVLYPIADALHLIHGPIGCASYTWDIRGAMSSGPQIHRLSFSTDLREREVVFGGEGQLYKALCELIDEYTPKAAFVYSTCIVGIIGDDVEAVCRKVSKEKGIDILPVQSEGFNGTKKDGYKVACEAIEKLVGTSKEVEEYPYTINILGDFNLAGELWILEEYYKKMGVKIIAHITGDGRVDEIRMANQAKLNVVQCSGSMKYLAKMMKEKYDIPFKQVSYFGIEDMSAALYDVADFFNKDSLREKARTLVSGEVSQLIKDLQWYKQRLQGKKAAMYVGGAFKAISLVKALRLLGIKTVIAGSQTGGPDDYKLLQKICDNGTILLDDTNPVELSHYMKETGTDILIGGVKERPLAFKIGIGFCDHNHERKLPLAGYEGMMNFAKEVHASVTSPVWQFFDESKIPGTAAKL